ncbi:hypothetical protein Bca4012_044063 [Brassica carinata]|uniref:Uncharacterized protein n=1 Tax=Brassica carinata TaxID=52824 RepID=A0A8X7QTD3_BRACI|nr:hypothetical protein Bca52824_058371 [Brassica carinata]
MDQSSNLPAFPASFVGGFIRPCRLFADPFSSPVPSWGNVPEADDEVVPVAPLRQHRSQLPDDDAPCSEIREDELEKSVDHKNPEEEYHRYLVVVGGSGPLGSFPLTASPPSVVGPGP